MVLFDCVCFYLVGLGWLVLLFIVVDCLFWWVGLVRGMDLFLLIMACYFVWFGGRAVHACFVIVVFLMLGFGVRLDCLGFCERMFA